MVAGVVTVVAPDELVVKWRWWLEERVGGGGRRCVWRAGQKRELLEIGREGEKGTVKFLS